jgi:hypothetical protein|tara:strand:+ start:4133 stop:4774 length:642 start_codon:yes stop_codon:yes gene_type:complete
MINYKIDDRLEHPKTKITEDELKALARSVIHSKTICNSAVIITACDEQWKLWNHSSLLDTFFFYRAHSVHQLLRSGQFKGHNIFIHLDSSHECSSDSLHDLLQNRINSEFKVFSPSERLNPDIINQFKGICQALELKTRINRVTDEFLTASTEPSINCVHRSFPTQQIHLNKNIESTETKAILSRKIQKILSDSPEDFLRHAIEEIKGKDPNP